MTRIRSAIRVLSILTIIEITVVALVLAIASLYATRADAATAPHASRTVQTMPKPVCILPRTAPRKGLEVKGVRAGTNQRKVLAWLVNEAHRRHLPRVFAVAAVAATTQESSAREIAYGEGTSVGPLQLISSHGTAAQRRTIEFSGTWFYNGARKVYRRGMTAGQLAQAVERSGYPSAYNAWVSEARRTVALISGPCALR